MSSTSHRDTGRRARTAAVRRLGPLAALAAAVAIAGCQQTVTSAGSSDPTPSSTGSVSTPSTSAPGQTTAPAPVTTTTRSSRLRYLNTWQSPSGNVICRVESYGFNAQVACQIGNKHYPRPGDAARCAGAGAGDNAVRLSAGSSARWACVSDYWGGANVPVLDYGEVVRVGPLVCESTTASLTCWQPGSPYGFSLSRARAELR